MRTGAPDITTERAPVRIVRRPADGDAGALSTTLDPLLRRLYAARGDVGCALSLSTLHPFDKLHDIDRAVDLLEQAIRAEQHILVVGDYDADGATGTALAIRGLVALGAQRPSYLIPSRFKHGYGLSPPVVDAAAAHDPDLILTVDNGIASHDGVERARELGIPVLVTDHHLPGEALPGAVAIVNPNQPGCAFPSKHLCGVGVMFYLLVALRGRLRETGWFRSEHDEPNLAAFLDLVALGTVADVVTLDDNNRVLVEQGLRRIRAGRCCRGVTALLEVAGKDPSAVTSRDLGFYAAPRLNAAGRLGDMSLGIECLLTDDPGHAQRLARRLDELNRQRREIEGDMREEAESLLDGLRLDGEALPAGLCLFGEGWHQGVAGILAARVRERYHRPVIAFANADGGLLRGSARSIDGLHIRDLIDAVDRRCPGVIERFGGHAMAAGLSLRVEALERFRGAFVEQVQRELGDRPPVREILSDGELGAEHLTLNTAEMLRTAGPWGKGFPEPLFDGEFRVLQRRLVGGCHLKLRLQLPGLGVMEAIGFNQGDLLEQAVGEVHLAYRLDVNEYRGLKSPQLILEHLQSTNYTSWKDV